MATSNDAVTTSASHGMAGHYEPPMAARGVALVAAAGVLLTGLFGLYQGAAGSEHASWFVIAFEVVSILAGVFALLVGMGRFSSAAGVALVCCAGAVGAGALLEFKAGAQVLPKWFVLARVGLTLMLGAASVLAVLARNPGPSVRFLTRAAMFGVPLLAIVVGGWMMRGQLGVLPDTVKLLGGFLGFLLVTGLAAGAVHCGIRAFEVCDEDPALR